jgi:hypothetical protein
VRYRIGANHKEENDGRFLNTFTKINKIKMLICVIGGRACVEHAI